MIGGALPPRHSRESGNPPSSWSTSEEKLDPRFRGGDEGALGASEEWDLSLLKKPPARLKKVAVCGPHTVRVEFDDGVTGQVRFEESRLNGVFEPMRDPKFFAQAFIDHGALAWPGELDMCPDAIYMQVVKNGEWVLR
jgi:hypothetical protein